MEAIAAGASVLPFVVLCIQSVKVVYVVISSIKDAPKNVRQLHQETSSLLSTLERLSACRVLREEGRRDDALLANIKACREEIDTYATKLRGMAPAPGGAHRRLEIQWKRLKAVLSEKDMAKMSAAMTVHTAALGLHLNAIQRQVQAPRPARGAATMSSDRRSARF